MRPAFDGPNTGTTQVSFIPVLGRRVLRVVRVEQVTPRYRRIALGGADLSEGFPSQPFAPTDHVKVFFPDPRTGELVLPTVGDQGWQVPPGANEPIFRDYTVRAWDPAASELTLDFVVHHHGVAGAWAAAAEPGQELGVLGPRGHVLFPENYAHYVAAGDETALPAISRIIEQAPTGARVTAVIEIADATEEQPLVRTAGPFELHWVHRDTAPVGDGHLSALETTVRGMAIDPAAFVFVAGETGALKPIRRYLRRELGLPKEQVDVDGYWKKGTANLDHHETELDDED